MISENEAEWRIIISQRVEEQEIIEKNNMLKENRKSWYYIGYCDKNKRSNPLYLEAWDMRSRSMLARLRSGSNSLRIDRGRNERLTRSERRCKVCNQGIEDEVHFLLKCSAYEERRKETSEKIGKYLEEKEDHMHYKYNMGSASRRVTSQWNRIR